MLDDAIHRRQVEIELSGILRLKLASFQLDHHIATQVEVVEQEVDKNNPNFIVKRLDPFARVKEKCDKCQNLGYDYLVIERSKEGR